MTLEELRNTIAAGRWTFAKSMPQFPHEYVIRGKTLAEDLFVPFVTHIRDAGVTRHWRYGKIFTYLAIDEYEYWTMGNPVDETIIINRALIHDDTNRSA